MSETKRYIYVVREDWHGIICVSETIYSGLLGQSDTVILPM